MYKETAKQVLDFIQKSPSCFHAVAEMAAMLKNAGYEELRECESWELKRGGKYFTDTQWFQFDCFCDRK